MTAEKVNNNNNSYSSGELTAETSVGTDTTEGRDHDALKLETALGHKQALERNFGLFSLTSLGIVIAK